MTPIGTITSATANDPSLPSWERPAHTTTPKTDTAAINAAKADVAKANATVDTDKRNHSPDCVAVDQKLVVAAELALTQAQTPSTSNVDFSA